MDLPSAVALSLLPGAARFAAVDLIRRLAPAESLPLELLVETLVPDASFRPSVPTLLGEAGRTLARGRAAGLDAFAWGDPRYPAALQPVVDAPAVLWVRGRPEALAWPGIAVVGARAASPAARDVARRLGHDLAAAGLAVVSGLARGVDAEAHLGALETGTTIAVLGCGADRVYPAEHDALAARIVAAGGAIVSEFPPGTAPRPHHFPLRNRIISGLTRGVVVVEASAESGSLITARLALDQGREVMAVPGSVAAGRNRGGHALLRDGAALVEDAADVVEALGFARPGAAPAGPIPGVSADPLLAALTAGEPADLETLMAATGQPAPLVLQRLLVLELAGAVVRAPGGRFLPVEGKVVT